ncbi:fibrous sheath-interacting protein 1-like isoform X2 [Synchiropus splendidus]|uniref:fibrous sheath-interacting protein 1-like isoform X2 n=1 Tax=Synchiropus splendidus TaxID=270530 RepID=UPI00237E418A|nr:fibrous sheath-interacting protein 1-like isoform X2 [Synchiropus splendidus]
MIKSKIPRPQKENLWNQQVSPGKADSGTHTSATDSDPMSSDVADNQRSSSPEGDPDSPGLNDLGEFSVAEDEEANQQEFQKAIEEMARLDSLLLSAACKEKVAKRHLRESKSKLWRELQENIPYGHVASAKEARNTEMFLALDSYFGFEGREDSTAASRTPDDEEPSPTPNMRASPLKEESSQAEFSRWSPNSSSEQTRKLQEGEMELGETGTSSRRKTDPGQQETSPLDEFYDEQNLDQRDTEEQEEEDGDVVMTEAEKTRLAELLWDINGGTMERGQGDSERNFSNCYAPEASEMEALREIDAKLRKLLSDEEFLSVQSTFITSLDEP